MTRKLPLSRGQFCLVDDEVYPRVSRFKWHMTKWGYAARTVRENGQRTYVYLHRFILGAADGETVDHIDGNRLNNTRSNLRIVTPSQNQFNRQLNKNSSSGYKGVCFYPDKGKWDARIQVHKRRIRLGYFDNPVAAARAYDAAARFYFGEYACLNFPEQQELAVMA